MKLSITLNVIYTILIVLLTLQYVKEHRSSAEKEVSCSIMVSDAVGNRSEYIGTGHIAEDY